MNTQLPPDNDNDLPDKGSLPGEDELGALYRKLPRKEPGPALDAAVLRAAAQAIRADQPAAASAHAPKRPRWPIALGSAAVLVLAAGLGWRMRDMPASTPPVQAGAVTVQETAKPAAPAVAAAPAATDRVQGYVADAASPPPAQAPERMASAKARQAEAAMAKRAAPAASIALNAPLQEPSANTAAPAAAPVAADQAAAAELRSFAPKQAERLIGGHPAEMPRTEAQSIEPPATAGQAVEAAPGMLATPAPPPAAGTARNPHDTPAQELDKIRQLLAAHRRDEARQRLADFHRDRPDYPLPDDLRAQLLTP